MRPDRRPSSGGGDTHGPVIVGVDGSDRGEKALEYGFDYAARHGLEVQALHMYPYYLVPPPYPTLPVDDGTLRECAGIVVQEASTDGLASIRRFRRTGRLPRAEPRDTWSRPAKAAACSQSVAVGTGGSRGCFWARSARP